MTELGQAGQQIEVLERRVLSQNAALLQAQKLVKQHEERIKTKEAQLLGNRANKVHADQGKGITSTTELVSRAVMQDVMKLN